MKIINDNMGLENFDAWSGAVETKEAIIAAGKADEFDRLMEGLYPDGMTDTQLNDILWFEEDWIFEMLGMSEEDAEEEE